MAITAEEINVIINAQVDKAIKDLKKADKQRDKFEVGWKKVAKSIAGPAVAGLTVKAFIDISKASSRLAADAEEVRSKFKVVFGESARAVNNWASDYSEAVGRSETDTLNFLGIIGDTLKPLGFTGDAVNDLSTQVVALAGDLGSFNNIPTQEVIEGIQSALVGNVETLRRYGVVANEAAIKAEALNSGLWDGEGALDAQTKAQAILNITLAGTKDAQGDLLRTQDSATNVTASLNSTLKETAEIYGDVLNKGLTPIKAALQDELAEINKTIKAYFLKNKVLAGEATLVEELISKQNDQKKAEEELLQAKDNLANSTSKINELRESERIELQNSAKAIEASIPGQEKLISQRETNVEAIKRQVTALQIQIQEEQHSLDLTKLLNGETEDNTELLDENTESVIENATAVEALTGKQRTYFEAVDEFYKKLIRESEFGKEATISDIEEIGATWQQMLTDSSAKYFEFGNIASGIIGSIDSLADSAAENEIKRLEESGASEEALNAKKKQLARENAAREKLAAVFSIGLDTAQAIIGFLASPGGYPGIALSVAAGVQGTAATAAALAKPVPAFAQGGSFLTSGAQQIEVGDNAGGVERVTVEPVSSAGANESFGGGGGNVTLVVDGKQFTAHFQKQIDNRAIRSSKGGAL
jgi:hypothetical protein